MCEQLSTNEALKDPALYFDDTANKTTKVFWKDEMGLEDRSPKLSI